MEPSEIEKYRERLLKEQTRLEADVQGSETSRQEIISKPGELSHLPMHIADQDAEGLDKELTLERNVRNELEAVTQALERTRDGTYGQCQRCGNDIARARLDALPFAAYCIDCERAVEEEDDAEAV